MADADVVRTLSVSKTTDLPWSGINSLVDALSGPAPLSPSDVTLKGSNGVDYAPVSVSVSGSATPYTINLGRSITQDLTDDSLLESENERQVKKTASLFSTTRVNPRVAKARMKQRA